MHDWNWMNGIYPVARLIGTLVRITLLMLLTALVFSSSRTPGGTDCRPRGRRSGQVVGVGFLAEILFVPVLILTVVVLAISIIGIPLLLLVPVAIVAVIVVMLVGFTAVCVSRRPSSAGRVDVFERGLTPPRSPAFC